MRGKSECFIAISKLTSGAVPQRKSLLFISTKQHNIEKQCKYRKCETD